ncbi:potassium channel family protein [Garciella nitratireducens]|uniref:Trk system potassium uptake protein TrkA n=1 Tax=Garciella nitratireducens DSM 15102 TaxID=1121911 RepID=A0A1T4K3A6_9FIRM|nr:TrkA family potassium uptake protein [Garciella nitratireducens]RBP46646.1 trk system potassium uptake protein TrkA [Garciella nitratireducens]SJZ36888.1 trk system potassium uptake protein TrkA [Garciella nitratireducens DSM 15102]
MKQFAVIGLGRFGNSLATTLYKMGNEVIAIDIDEEKVENIAEQVTYAVQADATDENILKSIGLKNIDVAVITMASNLEASILATLSAKELGIEKVYAKAMNDQHSKVLYKIGADKVFLPERDMGIRVAHTLATTNIFEMIELDPEHSIIEINAPEKWDNKTLDEMDFRAKYGVNVIAIKRGKKFNISPIAEDIIKKGDILVVLGENKAIEKLESDQK